MHYIPASFSTPQGFRLVDTPGIPSKHQAITFHSCCLSCLLNQWLAAFIIETLSKFIQLFNSFVSESRYIRLGCNGVHLFVFIDQATLSFGSHCCSYLFSALGFFDQLHFPRPGHISFAGSNWSLRSNVLSDRIRLIYTVKIYYIVIVHHIWYKCTYIRYHYDSLCNV